MNNWQKLGLPVALGFCAAYLNWQSISRKLEPRDYVAVVGNVKAGETFGKNSFKKVSVSHTSTIDLQSTLIPWSKRDALVKRFSQRSIKAGTLLTRFDIYEDNIAKKEATEVLLSVNHKGPLSFFVNDFVSVLGTDRRPIEGLRVLSIAPIKEGFKIELAIDKERLLVLETKNQIKIHELEIR